MTKQLQQRLSVQFLIALLLALAIPTAEAQTEVSGTIEEDTRWTTSGSPYVVSNFVAVQEGATLTVDPGVVVKFAANGTLTFRDGAQLEVNGAEADPVVFTSIKDDA